MNGSRNEWKPAHLAIVRDYIQDRAVVPQSVEPAIRCQRVPVARIRLLISADISFREGHLSEAKSTAPFVGLAEFAGRETASMVMSAVRCLAAVAAQSQAVPVSTSPNVARHTSARFTAAASTGKETSGRAANGRVAWFPSPATNSAPWSGTSAVKGSSTGPALAGRQARRTRLRTASRWLASGAVTLAPPCPGSPVPHSNAGVTVKDWRSSDVPVGSSTA
jgi:hypothetical protein